MSTSDQKPHSAQEGVHGSNETLEARLAARTKWLTLIHDVTLEINDAPSWDEALHRVLRLICLSEHWQIGFVYLPDADGRDAISVAVSCFGEDRFRAFHAASQARRFVRGERLPGLVYDDGVPRWMNDRERLLAVLPARGGAAREAGLCAAAALPVRFGPNVIAVLELFSDQPHEPSDLLENLMDDVSAQIGKVLERERATAQAADLLWREQQGLLHTLHDSLGQTLTGLGMLSASLAQQLDGNQAAAGTARQIAQQAQVALEQIRQLSRGLYPLEIRPDDLAPSLRELAATTEAFHRVHVVVDADVPAPVRDSRVATQLYRIAQEAVTNAVKHARPHAIRIDVRVSPALVRVRIADDGIGMPAGRATSDGLGLRIMRYRAASIGGSFSLENAPGGGTIVACTLREPPPAGAPPARS